eukprot:jgi/Psemu1/316191/fgenesh1_kg.2939_\
MNPKVVFLCKRSFASSLASEQEWRHESDAKQPEQEMRPLHQRNAWQQEDNSTNT